MDGMTPLCRRGGDTGCFASRVRTYDTLNGLLISRLDRIPEDGEKADDYGERLSVSDY